MLRVNVFREEGDYVCAYLLKYIGYKPGMVANLARGQLTEQGKTLC